RSWFDGRRALVPAGNGFVRGTAVSATTPPALTATVHVDRPPPRRRGRSRLFRPRDWRVKTKLAAGVTIPTLAFFVVAGVVTISSVRQATAYEQFAREMRFARQTTALVHEIQRERDKTAGVLAGAVVGAPRPTGAATDGDVGMARQTVDEAA